MAQLKDSGERRQFETGAVRDIQEGKGRCDLLPLDVLSVLMDKTKEFDEVLHNIEKFKETGTVDYLNFALHYGISSLGFKSVAHAALEVSKHFEDGAIKYGENNWQKGIPTHCYIDSAIRHYLKYADGQTDESHDRAFIWNLLCCICTCDHLPELNDYLKGGVN